MTQYAVTAQDLSKRFRLYHERNTTLKSTLLRRRRARYEEFWALRDVSIDVPSGTTFGLIGHNGSGKSTLLKCMAKILTPDEGSVKVVGKVSALLELGAGFHPELTGRENVYLNGSILGLTQRDLRAKMDDIVAFAGLERFIDSPVKTYSSGMYVRLGFSVAINVDPDVLLIDEVLAVGDEEFQRRCNEKVSDLKSEGRTIVVVSHGLAAMRTLCDEVAWLEHGRIREVGDAGDVVDQYVSEVHVDRVNQEGAGARWGSGEARIEAVELLDGSGDPAVRIRTGEPVTVRLRFKTTQPVEQPVFGLTIKRTDGILVTAPNVRDADQVPAVVSGEGTVDYQIPRMALLPGTYDLGTTVEDHARLHNYDVWQNALRFDVDPGSPRESSDGLVTLGGTWQLRDTAEGVERRVG